ncbi:MAG: signal peptidase I [Oscillospiraceae bacterium]|nr:signal peptidase I [Oscillospiraceae bacterium]
MDAIYIAALIWTIYMLFFRVVVVVGPSMYDTLIHGDRLLLVSSLVYQQPQQGDIIVCSKESFEDGTCFIKRVIAIEGQEVDIDFEQGIVYVDGIALEEDYIYTSTNRYEGVDFPVVVEDGHVFVMGDNRANSTDSRSPYIGQVDTRQIVGKAVFLISPGDNNGTEEPQYSRVGWID